MNTCNGHAAALATLQGQFDLAATSNRLHYAPEATPLLPGGTVFLARHGETLINQRHDDEGWANSGLDEPVNQLTIVGREQARQLSMRLLTALAPKRENRTIRLFTSELTRAKETAAPFIAAIQHRNWRFRVVADANLNEIDLGLWNNRLISELPAQSAAMRRFRFEADALVKPPGGESFVAFLARTREALQKLICQSHAGPTVVITHSTVITALRMHAMDPTLQDEDGGLRWTGRGIEPAACLYFRPGTAGFQPLA